MKTNRLFGILYLLLSHGMMTAGELADYFEVSVRTIYRDIDALSELNIPVYMSKGKNGGIGLLAHYRLDKTLLNEQEQDLILFSLQQPDTGLAADKTPPVQTKLRRCRQAGKTSFHSFRTSAPAEFHRSRRDSISVPFPLPPAAYWRKFSMITFSASSSVSPKVRSFIICSSLILPIAAS